MTKEEIQKNSEHWYNKYKDADKRIAELEATIRNTKAVDESFALQTMQLSKAKEIIKKLISLNRKEWIYSDVREEAEQFLNSDIKEG